MLHLLDLHCPYTHILKSGLSASIHPYKPNYAILISIGTKSTCANDKCKTMCIYVLKDFSALQWFGPLSDISDPTPTHHILV